MRFFVVLILVLLPYAVAQTDLVRVPITCVDPENPVMLEQEGFGLVQAGNFSAEDVITTFENARLTVQTWTLRAETLELNGAAFQAFNVCLERPGQHGTAARLVAKNQGDQLSLSSFELLLDSAPTPLPPGIYRLQAPTAFFENGVLNAPLAVLDRIDASGVALERYRASQFELKGSRFTASQLEYLTANFVISGEKTSADDGRISVDGIAGVLGRNDLGSEVKFSASSVLLLNGRTVRLERPRLNVFGLTVLAFPNLQYDIDSEGHGFAPQGFALNSDGSFTQPVRFDLLNGLTFGLEDFRLTANRDVRVSVVGHHLFTTQAALSFAFGAQEGDSSVVVGRAVDDISGNGALRILVQHQPDSGPTMAFNLMPQTLLFGDCQNDCDPFEDFRVGYAQRFHFQLFSLRPIFEIGQAWQPDKKLNSNLFSFAQSLGFTRVHFQTAWSDRMGDVKFTWDSTSILTAFVPTASLVDGAIGFGFSTNASIEYSTSWLQTNTNFSYSQAFGVTPIRRYIADTFTHVNAFVAITPVLPSVSLDFSGLRFEQPKLLLNLQTDFRLLNAPGFWRVQILELGFGASFYNGISLIDHLGQAFQTPVFSIAPVFTFNFAPMPKIGSLGAVFTVFGQSLAYSLGAFTDFKTDGLQAWRFNFGLRLR